MAYDVNPFSGQLDKYRSDTELDAKYLRLDCSNDPLTGTLDTQSVVPNTDETYSLGSSSKYWQTLHMGMDSTGYGIYWKEGGNAGGWGSMYFPGTGTSGGLELCANADDSMVLSLYADAGVGYNQTFVPAVFLIADFANTSSIMRSSSTAPLWFQPNNDTDDYVSLTTSAHQTTLNFVGQNGKITADNGTIDFNDDHLTGTGSLTFGSTYQVIIGDDANSRAAYITDSSNHVTIDGASYVFEISANDKEAIYATRGSMSLDVLTGSAVLCAGDGTHTVYLADGYYAYNDGTVTIDASGNIATSGTISTTGQLGVGGGASANQRVDITMTATDIQGINIDGNTNDSTNTGTGFDYAMLFIRDHTVAATAEPSNLYTLLVTNKPKHSDAVLTNSKFNYGIYGDYVDAASWTCEDGVSKSLTQVGVRGNVTLQGSYIGEGTTGRLTLNTYGVRGTINLDGTWQQDTANTFNVYHGVSGEIDHNPTSVTGGMFYYLRGLSADVVSTGEGTAFAYGLFINRVTGADTNYGIYDNSGQAWYIGNKLMFTQTDGNEYIDSLNDGYLDIVATTGVRSYSDTYWVGSGTGLPGGCMEGTDETVTCTNEDTWYQVTFDESAWSNLTTINLTNEDMAVTYAGRYQVAVTVCAHSAVAHDFEFIVKKNDGATDLGPHLFQSTSVANQIENVAGVCFPSLSASDRLELWVQCTDAAGQDIIFDHVNLSCVMVGG